MADYSIAELPLCPGTLGIAAMPGRAGFYQGDLTAIMTWGADLVLTMTGQEELTYADAEGLGADLEAAGVAWRHLPIRDMGAPPPETEALWAEASSLSHGILQEGGRVLAHCYGGCGRSGMALLRLMVEAGEDAEAALDRLRRVRPCAVETEAQYCWAAMANKGTS